MSFSLGPSATDDDDDDDDQQHNEGLLLDAATFDLRKQANN